MKKYLVGAVLAIALVCGKTHSQQLRVAFGEREITPDVNAKPVWIAGYGHGRRATGIHDPLWVRSLLLSDGKRKVALLVADLVGLQYPTTQRIRERLAEYDLVIVASTHNHEGPDVIGIWGPTPFQRGVDDSYLDFLVQRSVESVRAAEREWFEASAEYGTAEDASLLRDSREPYVKDGVLRAMRFRKADGTLGGVLVQWNCHPETLGSRNTLLTADFPTFTVERLRARLQCPVLYFSGAVGGLMTNPSNQIREGGAAVTDGTFEYARQYGEAVADLAAAAFDNARPVVASPLTFRVKQVAVPIENQLYKAAQELGVLKRPAKVWMGNPEQAEDIAVNGNAVKKLAVETEVAYLRMGDVHVAAIPGELYPELVYGGIVERDPGSDFPDAELEPTIASTMPSEKWLLIGLGNDELGYLIPKRQWDAMPPFCFGRDRPQYGEQNSCGPDAAAILMRALSNCVKAAGE